jgi:spore coat-associated protein N
MNNNIYLCVLAIGMAATVAGAGTWAYFTDTATSTENKFTAGTLKLEIGDTDSQNLNFSVPVKPGDTNEYAGKITVKNIGSINGALTAQLGKITEYDENNNPTGSWENGYAPGSSMPLADDIHIYIYNSTGLISDPAFNNGKIADCGLLPAETSEDFTFRYSIPFGDEDNSYQGHYLKFNIVFKIEQEQD